MNKAMLISVVLSFRNEEQVLLELIRRLEAVFDVLKLEYELIFVNDASTDNSLKILIDKSKADYRIKIINMARRFGVAQCIMAGMKYSKGDAAIYMDADLQDPPELIPELIDKWKAGADVVYTTRTKRIGENIGKMWLTKWAYRVSRFLSTEVELPMDSGDFKLLDRRVIDELLKLEEKDPYIKGLVSWLGFKQVQVFYVRERRFAGKTHCPILGLNPLKSFISGITSFSTIPLLILLLFGILLSSAAFILSIYMAIMKILGRILPGWSLIMVAMLMLGGLVLFSNGIMGLYIGRIYNEAKNRPNYIIDNMTGF